MYSGSSNEYVNEARLPDPMSVVKTYYWDNVDVKNAVMKNNKIGYEQNAVGQIICEKPLGKLFSNCKNGGEK